MPRALKWIISLRKFNNWDLAFMMWTILEKISLAGLNAHWVRLVFHLCIVIFMTFVIELEVPLKAMGLLLSCFIYSIYERSVGRSAQQLWYFKFYFGYLFYFRFISCILVCLKNLQHLHLYWAADVPVTVFVIGGVRKSIHTAFEVE